MTMSAILALFLASAVPLPHQDALQEARSLIRQGRLSSAADHLGDLGRFSDPEQEASRALLLGNIEYERGDYLEARSQYLHAIELLEEAGASGDDAALAAARVNLQMSDRQLAREHSLGASARLLRIAVTATMSLGALVAAALYWTSRPLGPGRAADAQRGSVAEGP